MSLNYLLVSCVKEIVHPKMISLVTHPQVVSNLFEFLSSVEHKRMCVTHQPMTSIVWKDTNQANG